MATSLKESLFAAIKPREEVVEIHGHKIHVRELETAADTEAFRTHGDATYKFVVRCCFDDEGNAVFTDDDIPRIKGTSRKGLLPLIEAVALVNGFNVESEAKNSAAGPAAG